MAINFMFYHTLLTMEIRKAYQKKDLWLIGLELILLIWLYSYGLKLRLLLLRVKKNRM
jgi:hypothetical protein